MFSKTPQCNHRKYPGPSKLLKALQLKDFGIETRCELFGGEVLCNEAGLLVVPFGAVEAVELERGVWVFSSQGQCGIASAGEIGDHLQCLTLPILIPLGEDLAAGRQSQLRVVVLQGTLTEFWLPGHFH